METSAMPMSVVAPYVGHAGGHQELLWIGGNKLRVLLDAAATGGQLTVIEEFPLEGDTSPMHVHHHEDEMFLLLEGSMRAWVGDRRFDVEEGGIAFLPRGTPHAYRFTAPTSRALLLCTPAGIEEMFREVGWDLAKPVPPDWSVSLPLLGEVCARTGRPIVGPPPGTDA